MWRAERHCAPRLDQTKSPTWLLRRKTMRHFHTEPHCKENGAGQEITHYYSNVAELSFAVSAGMEHKVLHLCMQALKWRMVVVHKGDV